MQTSQLVRIALEDFFFSDLLMDGCILAAVQRALDRTCLRRLFRALLVLQCFGIAGMILHLNPALLQLAAYPFAAMALLGKRSFSAVLEAAASILCGYAAGAGFLMLTGKRLTGTVCLLGLFCMLLFRRRHIRSHWNIEIILEKNGHRACFPALIDTGNRLREQFSGLPVLIAESAVLGKLTDTLDPDACITLPYGVLGSSGEISCFRPDGLYIRCDGRRLPAPECLIAVFPQRISGRLHALAPPEFAAALPASNTGLNSILNTYRRFYYGVFKHKAIHLRPGGTDAAGFGMLHRRQ